MFRKTFSTITDLFKDTAELKHQAAIARNQEKSEEVEPSYEIFLNSCANVSAAFEDIGFTYAKSGPHMTKKEGGMKFTLSFQTSSHNVLGKYVQILISANVKSSVLKKWRGQQTNPYRDDEWVAGGLVHLIDRENAYLEWDLADKQMRPKVIEDAIQYIRIVVIPFFSMFKDPNVALNALEKADIPSMQIANAVEFALCFGIIEQAETILNRYIKEHTNFIPDIKKFLEDFRMNGYPKFMVTQYAGQIAWMCHSYGLEIDIG